MEQGSSTEKPATPARLYGARARQLVLLLADRDLSHIQLAERYGVSRQTIYNFEARHAVEIAAVQADRENEYAGMLLAQKENRVAELISDIERIEAGLGDGDLTPDADRAAMLRVRHAAIKQVAEELGQITSKIEARTSVVLEGVDLNDLK